MDTTDKSEERQEMHVVEDMAGAGTAGAVAGAVIGALTGGPVGAAAGASLGGMVGVIVGGAATYGANEPELRRHYESSTTAGSRPWEDVSPAYRHGWESHDKTEYHGKSWDQVNTDLQNSWTGGNWPQNEPHVKTAWEQRARLHNQNKA